jgi:rhodanese-related sulfurtransferase
MIHASSSHHRLQIFIRPVFWLTPDTKSAQMYLTGALPGLVCHMDHSPRFLKLVAEAKTRVREITIDQARAWLQQNPGIVLLDVREDSEWSAGHAVEAVHLGKGVLERDLEKKIPDVNTEIIMYCGGGYRSVLTCDAAQKMGYHSVHSLIGGYRGMVAAGWPMEK